MFSEHFETPDELLAWAKSKEPKEYVGRSGDPCNCPIARFLIEIGAVPEDTKLSVGIHSVGLIADENTGVLYHNEYLPMWAKETILDVDQLEKRQIPAEDFLAIVIKHTTLRQT